MPPIIMPVPMEPGSNWRDQMTFPDSSIIYSVVSAPCGLDFLYAVMAGPALNISGMQPCPVKNKDHGVFGPHDLIQGLTSSPSVYEGASLAFLKPRAMLPRGVVQVPAADHYSRSLDRPSLSARGFHCFLFRRIISLIPKHLPLPGFYRSWYFA